MAKNIYKLYHKKYTKPQKIFDVVKIKVKEFSSQDIQNVN